MERKKPHKLLMLEAIVRRLKKTSPNYAYFLEYHRKMRAGFAGERYVDRIWQEMHLPSPTHLVHDYCFVNDAGYTHQVDTLFVTPHFLCVIEIKNIAGRLDFDDEKRQCLRTLSNGQVDSIAYPVDQLNRHVYYLQRFLAKHQLNLPIVKAVVIANPTTIIGQVSAECTIIHSIGLPHFLHNCWQKFTKPLPDTAYTYLINELNNMHHEKLWVQEMAQEELKSGVLCPMCQYEEIMYYLKGTWFCRKCGVANDTALMEALQDYRLLRGNMITNALLCKEFNVPSKNIAYRILHALKYEKVGNTRFSQYKIPES